jgi:hypothetical protein
MSKNFVQTLQILVNQMEQLRIKLPPPTTLLEQASLTFLVWKNGPKCCPAVCLQVKQMEQLRWKLPPSGQEQAAVKV